MGQNDVRINVDELNFIIEDIKKECLKLIFETKRIEGYTCKSEVVDNYVKLYQQIYKMIDNYYDFFLHDLKSIIDIGEELKRIDAAIAFSINNSHQMGGD